MPIARNVLAVVLGLVAGSAVNMGVILLGPLVVPSPVGADLTTPEGIKAAIPRLTTAHFLVPLLAHGLGTFAGGVVAASVAASRKVALALVVGAVFLGLGAVMVGIVGGPAWFVAADLALAYLPAAWLGGRLGAALSERVPARVA